MAFQDITGIAIAQAVITTGYTTIYTVLADQRLYIKDMDVCNTTAGALTVTIHLVQNGNVADTTNAIFYGSSIAANDNLQWTGTQLMDVGGTIQVKASGAGLVINISGGVAV